MQYDYKTKFWCCQKKILRPRTSLIISSEFSFCGKFSSSCRFRVLSFYLGFLLFFFFALSWKPYSTKGNSRPKRLWEDNQLRIIGQQIRDQVISHCPENGDLISFIELKEVGKKKQPSRTCLTGPRILTILFGWVQFWRGQWLQFACTQGKHLELLTAFVITVTFGWILNLWGQTEVRGKLCCRLISDSILRLFYFTPRSLVDVTPWTRRPKKNYTKEDSNR